jgi:hypothetical protein
MSLPRKSFQKVRRAGGLRAAAGLPGLRLYPARAWVLRAYARAADRPHLAELHCAFVAQPFPGITPDELEQARGYAYGGCVIQDIGYYPFGDRFFSDLTHYVRSGDFVVNLFRNAHNANEIAFAIGTLSHYIGDTIGHPQATNLAVHRNLLAGRPPLYLFQG